MAVLDLSRGVVVVRIVYDGAPYAGKTSSLRTLARSLGSRVETPMELAERTVYFDWLEYTGGLYEGYQIHCQILSVPGQRALETRRRKLLELADAVVFVLDSSSEQAASLGAEVLGSTRSLLAQRAGGPVGVVLQANKRDRDGALPRETLRELLGADAAEVAITEASAEEGFGIRETFVFAVRLAIDRLRLENQGQSLVPGRPDFTSPAELMEQLELSQSAPQSTSELPVASSKDPPTEEPNGDHRTWPLGVVHHDAKDEPSTSSGVPRVEPTPRAAAKRTTTPNEGPPAFVQVLSAARRRNSTVPGTVVAPPAGTSVPKLPSPSVASGAIWPPVEGRVILHEVAALGMTARQADGGGWTAGAGTAWVLSSGASQEFRSFEAGRQELLVSAREHALLQHTLSPHRAVVLAETGSDTWRVWQIFRRSPSLREWVSAAVDAPLASLYEGLIEAAAMLTEACERLSSTRLRPTLDNFGRGRGRFGGTFVGPLPAPNDLVAEPMADSSAVVSAQLAGLLAAELAPRCHELATKVVELWLGRKPWDGVVSSAISSAFKTIASRGVGGTT